MGPQVVAVEKDPPPSGGAVLWVWDATDAHPLPFRCRFTFVCVSTYVRVPRVLVALRRRPRVQGINSVQV
jgi:hypothetical protein